MNAAEEEIKADEPNKFCCANGFRFFFLPVSYLHKLL